VFETRRGSYDRDVRRIKTARPPRRSTGSPWVWLYGLIVVALLGLGIMAIVKESRPNAPQATRAPHSVGRCGDCKSDNDCQSELSCSPFWTGDGYQMLCASGTGTDTCSVTVRKR
jgi:hypothetical protein